MIVSFICPRPVVVSAISGDRSNMFPMNRRGSVSDGYFAFALDSTRRAAPLVARAGSVALSSIPIAQSEVARLLGKNHKEGVSSVGPASLPHPAVDDAWHSGALLCLARTRDR